MDDVWECSPTSSSKSQVRCICSFLTYFFVDLNLAGVGGFQKVKSIELKFDYRCEVAKLPLRFAQSVIEQLSGHPVRVLEREIQVVKAGEVLVSLVVLVYFFETGLPKEPAALVETAVIKSKNP